MERIKNVNELIALLEDDVYSVSVETNVYPSVYIAVAIHEYNKYGEYFIIANKNPYNSFLKENTYFHYKDAIRQFAIVSKLFSKTLLTEYNVLKKIYNDEKIIQEIIDISVKYHLNNQNIKFLSIVFSENGNIIDVESKSNIEIYFVKRFSNSTTLLRTIDLVEAKRVCDRNVGSVIVNSKGDIIYGQKDTHKVVSNTVKDMSSYKDYTIGTKINLINANLYEKYNSVAPKRSITGTYIICSDLKNNRLRISSVVDKDLIFGYVNSKDIQKINR